MADTDVAGTDAGGDAFEREFEAAREEQSGPVAETSANPQEGQDGRAGAEGTEGQAEGQQAAQREPLAPDEVLKRWNDSKTALREERRARQALESQFAEFRSKLEGAGAQQQQGQQDQGPPDPNADPLGALEWLQSRIQANDAKEAEERQAKEGREREAVEVKALTRDFSEAEADFRETTPDYDQAAKYLREARVKELMLFGHSEQEAIQLFTQEVLHTLRDVKARGLNPAQVAYGLAQQRGYAKKADGAGTLDTIARGQAAAKSLSGVGGKGSGELTVENVGNLKGAAFDKAFAKLMEQEREREKRLA